MAAGANSGPSDNERNRGDRGSDDGKKGGKGSKVGASLDLIAATTSI